MTIDELIRVILEYMSRKGMLDDLKKKYGTKAGEKNGK